MFASTFGQGYWKAALDYWRMPDQKSWILVNPASIGDTWCTLALCEAFRAEHGGPLTMVMRESQKDMAAMFPNAIDRLIVWEDQRLIRFCLRLRGCGHFDIDEPIVAHPIWHGNSHHLFPLTELLRYPDRGGVTFLDQWRLMLRLRWESRLAAHFIPQTWREEAERDAEKAGVDPGGSVILFPENNTNPGLPDSLWARIAAGLGTSGKRVFTNMVGNRMGPRTAPIPGTAPISVSLRTAIPLVEIAGRFVTMSNGIKDMILGAQARTEHTILMTTEGCGEDWGGLGYRVRDPMIQSTHTFGFVPGPFHEYLLDPNQVDQAMIDSIVRNDPAQCTPFHLVH